MMSGRVSRVSKGKERFVRGSGRSGAKRKPRNLLLMGKEKVGKTALLKRFLEGKFTSEHKPTVEDNYNIDYNYKNAIFNLEIIDMSGCYQFPAMRDLNIRKADMIMLVYELNDVQSLEEIKNINGIVKVARSDAIPTVLVRTKSDLVLQSKDTDEMERILEDFLEAYPDCSHVVTSAKDDVNIKEAFELVLDAYAENNTLEMNSLPRQQSEHPNKKCCTLL